MRKTAASPRQLIIIQTIATVITRKPVMAVAIKACSMRSIATAAPFSFQPVQFGGLGAASH